MAEMNRFSWSALFGCSLGAIRARRGWEPQNLNRRWRGAAPRQLFKNTAEMRRLCRCLSALLLLALALPVSLPGQRNPAAAALRDYGGLLPPSGHAALEAKALEVEAARGWKVVPSTYTSAIPQIGENFGGWLAGQTGTVLFYLPAGFEGGLPYIGVSPDLEGVLPAAARQDIVHQAMLAPYQRLDGEGALLAGMEALLTDRAVLAEVAFEGGYPIEGASIPQWRAEAGGEGAASSPLCYRRQDVMRLAPAFARIGAVPTSGLKIKAAADGQEYVIDGELGAGNIIRPADSQRIEIGTGDAVDYWPDFQVDWALSFDGGASWEAAGRSRNKVYVTWEAPILSFGAPYCHEPILYYGCNQAQGYSGASAETLVDRLWAVFAGRRLDIGHFHPDRAPKEITYYGRPFPEHSDYRIVTSGGPLEYDGECGAFYSLWSLTLDYQGVQNQLKALSSNHIGEYFFVKEWDFLSEGIIGFYSHYNGVNVEVVDIGTNINDEEVYNVFPDIRRENHEYEWIGTPQVLDNPSGIPGQNTVNPYSDFGAHFVALSNGRLYDPSYGHVYDSLKEWEDNAVSAFGFLDYDQSTGIYYLWFRKNEPSQEDIKW
jgi:hypothetical protein